MQDILLSVFNMILLAEYVVVFPSTDSKVKHFILLIMCVGFFLLLFLSIWMRDSEGKLDINEFGKMKIPVL